MAKNIKLLFLTGSPIVNDPYEIAVCYNMLNGYFAGKQTLFGEDYDDFNKYFVSRPDQLEVEQKVENVPVVIKNAAKFSNRIIGLTSYYSADLGTIKDLLPELYEPIVEKVPMSTKQYASYAAARDIELEESKRGIFKAKAQVLKKPRGSSSSYRVRSRQISNFLYPPYATTSYKDDRGNSKYTKHLDKITKETADELSEWSPKILRILKNASKHLPEGILDKFRKSGDKDNEDKKDKSEKNKKAIGPGIIYSQFLESGVTLMGKILSYYMKEIKSIEDIIIIDKNNTDGKKGNFAIISGDTDPEMRNEMLKLCVSPGNKKGELIALLLITATAAEGISTYYMRHVHVMEPFWHWARLAQIFARAARIGSHVNLPLEERNVQPYIYLSDYPTSFQVKKIEDTTDVCLLMKALQNQVLINSFLKVIQLSSIDCSIHFNCPICHPTDKPLFIEDLLRDMKSPSPCTPLITEKIVAKSVILEENGVKMEFMYTDKDEIHIFEYRQDLKGYEEIFSDHPYYHTLMEKLKKKKH
jgi:hypothetical protein